jgi:hypothetical protein
MTRTLLRLLLGGCLMAVPLYAAHSGESIARQVPRRDAATLPLPHVDIIPWLTSRLDCNNRPTWTPTSSPRLTVSVPS